MFLDNSFGSRQTTATHRQKGKQEKTVSHASHVSHYLLSPLLQHVAYCSGISLLLLAMEGTGLTADGNEWQEMASICLQLSPKEPSKREALREACPFLWPTLFVKHPQEKEVPVTPHHHPTKYVQRKKHCIFFFQRSAYQVSKPICKQVSNLYYCKSIFSSTNWESNWHRIQ